MSYVDLKHLLADLSLEAVREPNGAEWASVMAAYASLANESQPDVSWESVRQKTIDLAAPFGWRPNERSLDFLIKRGLLRKRGEQVSASADFSPHIDYLRRHAPRLLDVLSDLGRARSVGTDVHRGVALFNGRLFFECHEYLEGVWKATNGLEKDFYHGIVQIAAAFYHFEKRNWHGASTLVQKGLRKLAGYPDSYLGVNLELLRRDLAPWMLHFQNHKKHQEPQAYPRVELHSQKRQGAPRG